MADKTERVWFNLVSPASREHLIDHTCNPHQRVRPCSLDTLFLPSEQKKKPGYLTIIGRIGAFP